MVDIDAAIGFVVAHGDAVDRARMSWLRSGQVPEEAILDRAESGPTPEGGWPALWGTGISSVDATCFRLAELDDLGALGRPAAGRALAWLAGTQRPDGTWQEDSSLADVAPPWATPGDPEATLYLTATAGFWLAVGGDEQAAAGGAGSASDPPGAADPATGSPAGPSAPSPAGNPHAEVVARGLQAFRAAMRDDGSWPSYLAAGWCGGALLYHAGWFYEAARIQVILTERIPDLSPADVASLASAFRRVGMPPDDRLMVAARRRLAGTQRSDGGWPSDDGDAFDVHTTLTAIRAMR